MNEIWVKFRVMLEMADEQKMEKALWAFGFSLLMNFVLNVVGVVNCLYICIHLLFLGLLGVYIAHKSSPKIKLKVGLVIDEVIRWMMLVQKLVEEKKEVLEGYYEQVMQIYYGVVLPKVLETVELAEGIYENGVLSKLDFYKIVPKPVISFAKNAFEAT